MREWKEGKLRIGECTMPEVLRYEAEQLERKEG